MQVITQTQLSMREMVRASIMSFIDFAKPRLISVSKKYSTLFNQTMAMK